MERSCLREEEFLFWGDEMFWKYIEVVIVRHFVNAQNATEMSTLKWLILCLVNFISTKISNMNEPVGAKHTDMHFIFSYQVAFKIELVNTVTLS